jgi:CDP-diacylglycerol--serine O-phosphatidyltransferase
MSKIKGKTPAKAPGIRGLFIVKLNWVDLIALTGIMFSLISVLHSHYIRLENALAFMFVAMLVDYLDKTFEKIFRMQRLFGRFLDGFIDLLTYLIAPAVFFYYFGFERLHIVWILLLFGACGIVRLSVYDQIGDLKVNSEQLAYLGMPVSWAHFVAAAFYGLALLFKGDAIVYIAGITLLLYSFLMVFNRPFIQFENKPYMIAIIMCLLVLFLWLGLSKGYPLFG